MPKDKLSGGQTGRGEKLSKRNPLAEGDGRSAVRKNETIPLDESLKRSNKKPGPGRSDSGMKDFRSKRHSKDENSSKSLDQMLIDQPDVFKKCVIIVDEKGLVSAKVIESNSARAGTRQIIAIAGVKNRGHCFPDDEVVVEILNDQSRRSEEDPYRDDEEDSLMGKVIGVLKSANNLDNWLILCTADENNSDSLRPVDRTLPSLWSYKSAKQKKKAGHVAIFKYVSHKEINFLKFVPADSNICMPKLFVVRYLSWKKQDPEGVVIGVLPDEEPLRYSMRVLQIENRYSKEFDYSAAREVEDRFPEYFSLPDVELGRRVDYTNVMTLTIDPPDSKDFDDALSITELPLGQHIVGVHIADVSYFVERETALDRESRRRGTTVYEVSGREPIPMLPDRLSTDLCSLREGEKRLTLSVFLTTNINDDVINVELKRTVICSRFRLNYVQVEEALMGKECPGAELPSELTSALVWLNRISQQWRKRRVGHVEFSRQTNNLDYASTPNAHRVVEELMIMVNHRVAKVLLKRFPTCTPLIFQQVPDLPEIQDWRRRFPNEAAIIEMVQPFYQGGEPVGITRSDAFEKGNKFVLHEPVWEQMVECFNQGSLERLQSLILSPEHHPDLIVAWFNLPSFTKKAMYVCSGDQSEEKQRHFSLNLPHYAQFTSPIRRYLDLVVHRLVHCAIDDHQDALPYSQAEVSVLCEENQAIKIKTGNYESNAKNMHFAEFLRHKPLLIHTLIERAIDTGFRLNCLQLSAYLKLWPINIAFLGARKTNMVKQHRRGKVILSYSLRIYNLEATGDDLSLRQQEEEGTIKLNSRRNVLYTTVANWKELVMSVLVGNKDGIKASMEKVMNSVEDEKKFINPGFKRDISCEGRFFKPGRCAVDFTFALTAGDVIQIQVAGEMCRGKLTVFVQLMSLSPTVDVCLEHRSNAVKCFARLNDIHQACHCEHGDFKSLCKLWSLLVVLESAENAVAKADSFMVQNVKVTWLDGETGTFEIPVVFCRDRSISIFSELLQELDSELSPSEQLCLGFLCLRYSAIRKQPPETELPIRNVMDLSEPFTWVGHCVVTDVQRNGDAYKICFCLNQSSCTLPTEVQRNSLPSIKATVEWISNTKSERDMVRTLSVLPRKHGKSLAAAVVTLVQEIHLPPTGQKYFSVVHKNLDKILSKTRGCFDKEQEFIIKEALRQPFYMVSGYASSGKTLLAAQLAYRISKINKMNENSGQRHTQVMCCGPTEGCLLSLAEHLHHKSLGIDVVLVYSRDEERKDFPSPVHLLDSKTLPKEKTDDDLRRSLSLHHRIRTNASPNATLIKQIDEALSTVGVDRNSADFTKYMAAIEEEESLIIGSADVILCLCVTSVDKRLRDNANVGQVIIDDCQACTGPATLLPMASESVCQVILFGDVKQLKPNVVSPVARRYGLTQSLFERCLSEETPVLKKQYSMHKALLDPLAACFYDTSGANLDIARVEPESSVLAMGSRGTPFMFLDVIGTESPSSSHISSASTTDFFNGEEARVVGKMCKWLVERLSPSEATVAVLSPYEAQCSKIKKQLRDLMDVVVVSDVISAQGKHWDYVILSTVRSLPVSEVKTRPDKKWLHSSLGVLCSKNVSNFLWSRAYKGLVIVGNKVLLGKDETWQKLLRYFENNSSIVEFAEFFAANQSE